MPTLQGRHALSGLDRDRAAVAAPPRASARGRRRHWLGWGLAAFILLACAFWLDLDEVGATLARLHPAAALGLVLLLALDRVVMAWKWRLLLAIGGVRLPLAQAVRLYFQGTMAGAFMPSMLGGDVLRGYWASRTHGRTPFVFASLVMEKMLGFLSALHWGILGAVVLACWYYPKESWLWIGLGLGAALGLGALFILSLHPRTHVLILGAIGRFKGRKVIGLLHKLYEAYAHFSADRSALVWNYVLTISEHLLQMAIYLSIAAALGVAVQPVLFLAAVTVHTLILRIPVSPEGWGVGELSAIGFFSLAGIKAEAAFAIMVTFHIVVLIACAPGIIFLLRSEPPEQPA